MKAHHLARGVITLVQEQRFQLVDDTGTARLFLLAHDVELTPGALRALQRSGRTVRVEYEPCSALVAALATRVEPIAQTEEGRHEVIDERNGWSAFLRDWSLAKQLAGGDAMSTAAESHESRTLRPRTEDADTVGTGICPYCAVGCAQLVYAKNGKVIHIEGDPRSPINQGTLCPKGAATFGWITSERRVTKVRYRAPHSDHWEERPLDWAMDRIAQLVKETRDQTFVERLPNGTIVNHTLGIASLGGATLDNEENYLIKKLYGGGLGAVFIENQARV